ncbi:MAG: hypothetical protein IPK17_13480 [Chloroflexi bacterium]|uniref:hypothetical protein n=1 Tax=Candidatus Flexifilum breve TaxID=3140694 RepID=UPI003134A2C4|nr:hypothetical protein [Chloroflexota bacterium]
MVIVLFSGLKAVWNSFNRLFNAFGQLTGGAVISPGAATIMTAAGAVGAAGLAAVATGTVVGVGQARWRVRPRSTTVRHQRKPRV